MVKKIFKAAAASTALMLVLSLMGAASAQENVNTGFTRSEGGGDAPIIKAKWEMNNSTSTANSILTWIGQDDDDDEGAQFLPPGAWSDERNTRPIVFCAIATDPDGVADINAVYADIFYPPDQAFHPMDPAHPDQPGGGTPSNPDYGLNGCHDQVGDEILLTKLSKQEGFELFCNRVKNNNTDLPTFDPLYDYEEICAGDGELQKETAYVYCGVRKISWEDPAGDYWVHVHAADKAGLDSEVLPNVMTYLELTAFETDFTDVNYGNVKLNTHKIKNGDLTWNDLGDFTKNLASVRNIGNTRLYMTVSQDDMGLGSTNGEWNVEWDARVGSDVDFTIYDPFETVVLEDILDLSELEEMDFSILVKKFPIGSGDEDGNYDGLMTLGAKRAEPRKCPDFQPEPGADLSLEKSVEPQSVLVGEQATFSITVMNDGPDMATGVTVEDILPAGVTYVSDNATTTGTVYAGNIWTIGNLAASASITLEIVVTVDTLGIHENTAQVQTSDLPDDDSTPGNDDPGEDDQDSATVTGTSPEPELADLSLTKIVNYTSVPVGTNVTFTITVKNDGPDTATAVTVQDILPAGVTYVSDNGAGAYVSGTGIWTIGNLASGADASLEIIATVATQGDHLNVAQVETATTLDPDSTPGNSDPVEDDQDSVIVHGEEADLVLDKTVNDTNIPQGTNVIYHLTITNNGPDPATNVQVKDLIPAGVTFIQASGNGVYDSGTGIWTVSKVNVGFGGIVFMNIEVDTPTVGDFTNIAEIIASDQPDPNSTPNNGVPTEDDQDTQTITVTIQ